VLNRTQMEKVDRFEKLKCWQAARQLVGLAFKVCTTGPLTKDFGTSSQLKRASLSVMNNIAEGFGRESTREFIRFLDISQSSAMEVKSIAYVLSDLEYIPAEQVQALMHQTEQTKALTRGLMLHLRTRL
jgi:four helix bundle protein